MSAPAAAWPALPAAPALCDPTQALSFLSLRNDVPWPESRVRTYRHSSSRENSVACHAARPDSVAKLRTSAALSSSATAPTVSACRKNPSKYAKISRNSVKFRSISAGISYGRGLGSGAGGTAGGGAGELNQQPVIALVATTAISQSVDGSNKSGLGFSIRDCSE